MSLFPSASLENKESSKKDKAGKEWLENRSFTDVAGDALHHEVKKSKYTTKLNVATFLKEKGVSSSSFPTREAKYEGSHDEDDRLSASSADENMEVCEDSIVQSEMVVDKSSDMNNLYFKKPYRVYIPRFYRGTSSCVGLSPCLQIIFQKRKKKQRRKSSDRYFHFDEDMTTSYLTEEEISNEIKIEVEKLNIETRENQTNIDAWLQLIALQDRIPGKNIKLKTEKKVAILDKAISANPRNYNLQLQRLHLLESVSEDSDREWKNIVFHHPTSREVWEAYINHTLDHPRFTVQRTLKVFEKCFETLSAIQRQSHHSEEFLQNIEKEMVYMFTKLVRFLVEADHTELTVTLLLMMLEINLRSSKCNNDLSDVEYFYKSGDPLLGQPKSRGWDSWYQKHERGGWSTVTDMDANTGEEEDDEEVDFDKSLNENWLVFESKRGESKLFPWRLEEDCEDPGRKIVYDDFKGFLFLIKEKKNKLEILRILFQVIGTLPENQFMSSTLLLSQPCQLTHAYHCTGCLGNIHALRSAICSGPCDFNILLRKPHHEFLTLLCEQLATSCPPDARKSVCAIILGYFIVRMASLQQRENLKSELKRTYKESRKIAKTLLKNDPVNFLLWTKLAKIEFLAGNFNECKKIIYNALCMAKTQSEALLLCRFYCELTHNWDKESAKRVLTALGDERTFTAYLQGNKESSGAALLRAVRSMERICEELGCLYKQVEMDDTGELSSFTNAISCHILYMYLTTTTSIMDLLDQYMTIVKKESSEGSLQALRDLTHLHEMKISLINPDYQHCSDYRTALIAALDDVPNSPQFATKLCVVEVGSSLTSVARRLFSSTSDGITAFFSVYFELLRIQRSNNAETYSTPRILRTLERAVTARRHDVLLWRLYATLSKTPGNILTRASANCPWSKSLACDRVRLENENLDDVISFMQDKGIRVRTPVEEIRLLLTV